MTSLTSRPGAMRRDLVTAGVTVAAGLALIALGLVGLSNMPVRWGWIPADISPWWHALPLVVSGAAMLIKRRVPLLALVIGSIMLAADFALGGSIAVLLVWWDLIYSVGLYSGRRIRTVVTVVLGIGTLALAIIFAEQSRDFTVFVLAVLQLGAVALVPLWWASGVRQGHELAAASEARARLEAERVEALTRIAQLDRAEAVRAERSAMARDLHDVISSHLSAIAIHSGAALLGSPDVARDRAALTQVRAASLASLEEMRTMIELLRSEETEALATREGLSGLPTLVQWARDAGLQLTVEESELVEATVPTAVDQSALRIIQEALTNALKHGAGSARLAVELRQGALHIEVGNPMADVPTLGPSGGNGLASMRERAEALGGTLESAEQEGEWVMMAALPLGRGAQQ